jgi:hypothetical protein
MARISIRDGEFWRVSRLVKTYDAIPQEHQDKLVTLHDHKGHLSVYTTEKPISDELAAAIKNAWVEQCESDDQVSFLEHDVWQVAEEKNAHPETEPHSG